MISLRALLLEKSWAQSNIKSSEEERSVWQTYSRKFGGRNSLGQVRYFKNRDAASKFARGETKGPKIGRPKPKKRPERMEKIQKYDITPVTRYDAEKIQ